MLIIYARLFVAKSHIALLRWTTNGRHVTKEFYLTYIPNVIAAGNQAMQGISAYVAIVMNLFSPGKTALAPDELNMPI